MTVLDVCGVSGALSSQFLICLPRLNFTSWHWRHWKGDGLTKVLLESFKLTAGFSSFIVNVVGVYLHNLKQWFWFSNDHIKRYVSRKKGLFLNYFSLHYPKKSSLILEPRAASKLPSLRLPIKSYYFHSML